MKNNTKVMLSIMAGAIVGGTLAMLFAPYKGAETRQKIAGAGTRLSGNFNGFFTRAKEKIKSGRMLEKVPAES